MSSSAERMRIWRARQRTGKIGLRIEVDEVELIETLAAARLIERNAEPSHADLAHAVERLICLLGRQ